ncbi:tetratricopeptide repeat-containing sensor histidine kinase [Carboxylicivirga linearis]|uniref:Tetratricopeptide repeat protein n=1 Tax=Carboxylicivirga linearis TaxID=1628157 RepID=A0ABS5K0W6_9BACT|nr:tetratricopeptide repeat protein [Carboxylicivirga linearis]MBS2100817.1 tetratricopeptide repeat protein [Carboxylicivirga linearis]
MKVKKLYNYSTISFLFLLFSLSIKANEAELPAEVDSMVQKAIEIIGLADENPDSCLMISKELLKNSLSTDVRANAFLNEAIGESYYYLQEFDSAKVCYQNALQGYIAIGDLKNQATAYNNIGLINYFQGKYALALENYNSSLEIEKELKNEPGVARSHHNIGMVYGRWERYDQQFEHYHLALELYEKFDDQESIAGLSNNMGITYAALHHYDKALENYRKAYFAYKKLGNKDRMAAVSSNLGCLFVYQGENQRAIEYFNEAIEYFKVSGDVMSLVSTYSSTGDAYREVGDFKKAISYYELAEETNKDLELLSLRKDNYYSLYLVYKDMGDYEKSLQAYEYFNDVTDSIFTAEKYERLLDLEKKYHSEKSEKELLELKAKEQKQKLWLWGLSIFFIFSAILVLIGLYILKIKEKQQRQIMEHKVLRTQMNPHFIFNSLSALQCFIIEGSQEAAIDFVADFSSLMRLVLQYAKEESITLKKEKEILEKYMSLQNRRFENKIQFSLEIDETLHVEKVMVPPMLAQPFVENAIEHGGLDMKGDGFIKVMITKDGNKLAISVEDNGIGIKKAQQKKKLITHKSIAMQLTKERLRLLQEQRGKKLEAMEIEDLSDYDLSGTRIAFRIPYMEIS